jgi:hypothetical protein
MKGMRRYFILTRSVEVGHPISVTSIFTMRLPELDHRLPKQRHPAARLPLQPNSPSRLAINLFLMCESLSIYVAANHDFSPFFCDTL